MLGLCRRPKHGALTRDSEPIRRIRELQLAVNVNYGGGANEGNTTIQVEPQVIRVSASDAVLETLGDTFTLATIQLAELEKTSNDLVFPITLPARQ